MQMVTANKLSIKFFSKEPISSVWATGYYGRLANSVAQTSFSISHLTTVESSYYVESKS